MLYKPEHLIALPSAAQFIVEKMDQVRLLTPNFPGYLVVMDGLGQKLLTLHVGPYGLLCEEKYADLATISNQCIVTRCYGQTLINGVTSSNFEPRLAGSVVASSLIVGYASQEGHGDVEADEAVAIMIALKAGLLAKVQISHFYTNKKLNGFNPQLSQLMKTITWTD